MIKYKILAFAPHERFLYTLFSVWSNHSIRIRIRIQIVKHANEKGYFLANLFVENAAVYLLSRSIIMQSAKLNINLTWILDIFYHHHCKLVNRTICMQCSLLMQFKIHIKFDNIGYLIYSPICSMIIVHSSKCSIRALSAFHFIVEL